MDSLTVFDFGYASSDCNFVIGVDEVGRGSIFGPVVACACVFDVNYKTEIEVADSKSISPKKRNDIFEFLNQKLVFSFGIASSQEVDSLNVLNASLVAMERALSSIGNKRAILLVDGNFLPKIPKNIDCVGSFAIIKGDSKSRAIASASIFAKVYRDKLLDEMDKEAPFYGLKKNKGYPTKRHLEAIKKYGVLEEHRKTFAPVKSYLEKRV